MTDTERKLWKHIRCKQIQGLQFYRQKIIGNYIVDFYCHRARLVVEVDGGQHYLDEALIEDQKRDENLRRMGLRILRVSNLDVLKNVKGVVERIFDLVSEVE